ncbi:unnamed protein product [Anisakis simplex]|uniref:PDEase domain-containing protein n=1 Tax=Anisakis simplex TaxID=6269 RepID=A0A0M3JQX5_ANISI|nr:unnamed protein product [Anisakis simplex]
MFRTQLLEKSAYATRPVHFVGLCMITMIPFRCVQISWEQFRNEVSDSEDIDNNNEEPVDALEIIGIRRTIAYDDFFIGHLVLDIMSIDIARDTPPPPIQKVEVDAQLSLSIQTVFKIRCIC